MIANRRPRQTSQSIAASHVKGRVIIVFSVVGGFWLMQSMLPKYFKNHHLYDNLNYDASQHHPFNPLQEEDPNDICRQAAKHLHDLDIRLLALDFDQTIIDIHTGGHWPKGAVHLMEHVRPPVQCLMNEAMRLGLQVAVASFSSQEELLAETIRLSLSADIVVAGGRNRSEKSGKREQLERVLEIINARRDDSSEVRAFQALLIDDDKRNVAKANIDGYQAMWFDPDKPGSFLSSLAAWTPQQKTATGKFG